MFLCELYNLTIGIPAYSFNKWSITEDSKTIKGLIGLHFQSYINSRKSFPYNCKLVNIFKFGDKLENGSYDGALGAISRKEIDCFLKAEIPFTTSKNVIFSHPVSVEDYNVFQMIKEKKLDDLEHKSQLIDFFILKFFLYYCFVIILFTFTLWLIFNLILFKKSEKKFYLKTISFFFKNSKRMKYYGLFSLGLIWLNFLTKQFIANNIKTTKVIVDTSYLITTEEKLFESPLKAAWLEGETDLFIVKNAPKNTFLHKLFLLKNENPIKIFKKKLNYDVHLAVYNYFFFMKKNFLVTGINLLGGYYKNDGFVNDKPFYSIYSVFYITKGIEPEKIKFISKASQLSSELGLFTKMKNSALNIKVPGGLNNNYYFSLNSYIKDYTKFDSLKYENLEYFFLSLISLNFLFFLFFVIHCIFFN